MSRTDHSQESQNLLKNIGIDKNFFDSLLNEEVYIIRKEKIRKICSENAIVKLNGEENAKISREMEDIYGEVDAEFVFEDVEFDFKKEEKNENLLNNPTLISTNPTDEYHFKNFGIKINKITNAQLKKKETELEIFKNCSQTQIEQLNKMFSNMNSKVKNEKIKVKAYRSKLKSKFYEIYQENSEKLKERIKFKLFHKCNYPGCSRTFASSGWLRSHFKEHINEIRKNRFNILFDELILNLKNI